MNEKIAFTWPPSTDTVLEWAPTWLLSLLVPTLVLYSRNLNISYRRMLRK